MKQSGKKGRAVWIILAVVLIAVLAIVGVFAAKGNRKDTLQKPQNTAPVEDSSSEEETEEEEEIVAEGQGSEDFVIFGVDTRSTNLGAGTRSDSIMIVHVDHDQKTVKVASIYRDCMVHIEGHDYQKITHAHSFGGPGLALQTVNENFDLDIKHYMTVNFINVAELIDDIGGVEMEIDEDEVSHLSSIDGAYCGQITAAGTYLLDGDQAVTYSRIRHAAGGDYKRAERQRTVLFEVFEKAKTMSADARISLAEKMLAKIGTNYTTDDITSLLYYLSKYEIAEMTAYPQVFYGGTVDGAWVEVPVTLTDMDTSLHEFLYADTAYTPSDTVQGYSSVLQGKASTPNTDLRE